MSEALVSRLLALMPPLDLSWPEPIQIQWWKCYRNLAEEVNRTAAR